MNEEEYMVEYNKLIPLKKKELVKIYMNLIHTKEELNTTSDFGKFLLDEEEKELMGAIKPALVMWIIHKKEEVK